MDNCLFCRIIKGEIPARKVYEDDLLVAIEDIHPQAPVHLLLVPKRHAVNCLDLEPADTEAVGRVFSVAARLARERSVDGSGFRIVQNNNAAAGQSVWHIHFHLLAGRHFTWPPG